MALETLSPFAYFGGKARMAPLICDMLDYRNTNIYIEPFGGAGRVLLNKARHDVEIYNDSSAGLCAFMRIMSHNDTANELISRIYETEYTREEFYRALQIRNETEDHFFDEWRRQALLYVKQLIIKYNSDDLELLKENIKRKKISIIDESFVRALEINILADDELGIINALRKQFNEYKQIYDKIFDEAYKGQLLINLNEFKHRASRIVEKKVYANYSTLNVLDNSNAKGAQALKEKVEKLENILVNIKDIQMNNLDKNTLDKIKKKAHRQANDIAYIETANNHNDNFVDDMDLAVATYVIYSQSRDGMGKDWSPAKYKSTDDYHSQISRLYDVAQRLDGVNVSQVGALSYVLKCSYLNNERAMIYMDPSYIMPGDEEKNLGSVYKESFTYEDHELFLKAIYKAKCKILVSNYDTELYNKYLNKSNNWSRIEFETKTTVGGKKDNGRVEVLWYNY